MAKGNLFLGTAARSVGDVVMYRREGSQVSRVRVRKVANPRTDAQSLQRAAFSPVAKFYSPLAVVLERAFEGVSKSKSYSEFLKVNIKKSRENGWLLPKGTGFFPLPYQLTKGTLPVLHIGVQGNAFVIIDIEGDEQSSLNTIGDLSKKFAALGYVKGDIITFILVAGDNNAITTKDYVPRTFQFELDENSTATIAKTMPGLQLYYSDEMGYILNFQMEHGSTYAASVIVARFENDKWRRSKQSLLVSESVMSSINSADAKAAAVASYGNTAGSVNPLVYLDGSELEG